MFTWRVKMEQPIIKEVMLDETTFMFECPNDKACAYVDLLFTKNTRTR